MMRDIRVGGVPEHFNLPWRLAIEEGSFRALGLNVEWVDFPGGTGAIMKALHAGEVDIATPLTEGAIIAIANGNSSRIAAVFVESPLMWGVHVATGSSFQTIADTKGAKIAVSRHGSGSELMGYVMGSDHGWSLTEDDFVVVGGLDGALQALPAGEADVFLWSKTMTQPHVDDGTFRRIAVLPAPWPSFATTVTQDLVDDDAELVGVITQTAAARAQAFAQSDDAALMVIDRYGLKLAEAEEWLQQVRWAQPSTPLDTDMLSRVEARMRELGRIT